MQNGCSDIASYLGEVRLKMARPREFSPADALEKSMQVFWQRGYGDTSIDDLVDATGVSRYGLYAEFGSKRGLFLAALDHYAELVGRRFLSAVEQSDASLGEIRRYFRTFIEMADQPIGRMGCLMCNTATEVVPHDKKVAAKYAEFRERMTQAFRNALINARKRNEVSSRLDVERAADFLTGTAQGLAVMMRARAGNHAIANVVAVALATLE